MAIYFIQILAIVVVGATCNVNKSDRAKKRFLFFAFGLLILVAALRSVNVGTDLATHYHMVGIKFQSSRQCQHMSWDTAI